MNREIHVRICESLGAKSPGRLDPVFPNFYCPLILLS
jgi:hypothetical protein